MSHTLPPPPKLVRLSAGLVSAAVLLSALVAGFAAACAPWLAEGQKPAWAMFGFEVVIAFAAVIGVLLSLGKFRDGPALALACVAAAVFTGSVLGFLGANREIAGYSLRWFLLARVGAAAVLGAGAVACVLVRDRRSLPTLLKAGVLMAPVVAVAAMAVTPAGSRLASPLLEAGAAIRVPVFVLGSLVLCGLFAASVHLGIRAFELGRPTPERHEPGSAH